MNTRNVVAGGIPPMPAQQALFGALSSPSRSTAHMLAGLAPPPPLDLGRDRAADGGAELAREFAYAVRHPASQTGPEPMAGEPDALQALCYMVARRLGVGGCAVMLVDPLHDKVSCAASAGLPAAYAAAVDGAQVRPGSGACSAAIAHVVQVTTQHIDTDPCWTDWREAATAFGLRACVSTPIVGRDRRVLGSFDLYFDASRAPRDEDAEVGASAARLAALAIEHIDMERLGERYELAVEVSSLTFFEVDGSAREILLSDRYARLIGEACAPGPMPLDDYLDRVHPEDRADVEKELRATLRGTSAEFRVEHRLRHANGGYTWVMGHGRVVEQDAHGRAQRMAGTLSDISERRRSEEYIHQLAYYDPLTGLANRRLFQLSLERAVRRAHRARQRVGLLHVGLDRFRMINDALGPVTADRALQEIARRLRECVAQDDLVARPGGAQFAVVMEGLGEPHAAAQAARAVVRALDAPFVLDGRTFHITASIGIAVFPDDAGTAEDLLKHAAVALERAKSLGRSRYHYYVPHMDAAAYEQLALETSLREALADGSLALEYQPVVRASDTRVCAIEALMRWTHPELGRIAPLRVLPLAEECGLGDALGAWTLRQACVEASAWRSRGLPVVPLAINVSLGQLTSAEFVATVEAALRETGWPAALLQLDVTATALVQEPRLATRGLEAMRALGVRIALDDFGSGHASLASLKHYPIDALKVDRGCVADIATSEADAAIVQAIVAMAHGLKLEVVAEGVETDAQLALLRRFGVDAWQGYLCARPMPAGSLAEWLGTMAAAAEALPGIARPPSLVL